ncbi:Quinoprotein glucose dehydrogenase [Xanthomonas sacchari]|nr:Quinoprotein glucose dehydrogenase [Xanthomonas sacchari]
MAALGGSWYYLVAGLGLTISGVQLWRARRNGALWFAATFLLSLLWAAWESGTDYWRWVPRMGLMVFLALLLALLLPRLDRPFSRRLSRSLAAVLALVFVGAFALAFLPYGVTEAEGTLAHAAGMAAALASPRTGAQPADASVDADWAAYGRDNAGSRYTPLRQIAPGNVAQLRTAWTFRTGDLPDKRWGAETTPLKIGDSLYLCSARNQMIALDARSGRERWRYDPKMADKAIPYTAACRGVSYYAVPDAQATASAACRQRIIEGTLDGRLIAVDAADGKPCEDFGQHG